MKRTCLYLLFIPFLGMAQNQPNGKLVLDASVSGIPEGATVTLVDLNNTTDTVAKGVVGNGKFHLTGHVSEPNLYEITIVPGQKKVDLFVGNDAVTMTGNINDPQTIRVSGSTSNDDFIQFQQFFNARMIRFNSLVSTINATPGITREDTLMKQYYQELSDIEVAEDQFLQSKRASYLSAFMLAALMKLSDDVFLLEKRLNELSPEIQNSFYGKFLRQQIGIMKIGAVGSDEIDFTQNDTQGKPITLSSFKGKYVLIDFWASWCHPCRMENPNVVAVYNKFKAKNFTILSVSLDRSRDPWIEAIKTDNLTWTHVSDLKFWNNDVAVKYHVDKIPQNFLIDPSGKIVAKNLRGPDLESKLCELLGCN